MQDSKMGTQQSSLQQSVASQIRELLNTAQVHISNRKLEQFAKWLSVEKSDLNLEDMNSVLFWNEIGDLLTLKVENGDEKTSIFLPIFLQIRKILIQTENNTQPQILHPSLTNVLPSEQSSDSPNPLTQDTRHMSPGAQHGSGHMVCNSLGRSGGRRGRGWRRGRGAWASLSDKACRTGL